MNIGKIFKEWWLVGVIAAGLSWLLAAVVSWISLEKIVVTMSTIDINTGISKGIDPAFGNKVLSFFQGKIPFDIGQWGTIVTLVITAVAVVIVGRVAYEYVGTFVFKRTTFSKIMFVMIYGGLAIGILMSLAIIKDWRIIITTVIYSAVIALAFAGLEALKLHVIPNE